MPVSGGIRSRQDCDGGCRTTCPGAFPYGEACLNRTLAERVSRHHEILLDCVVWNCSAGSSVAAHFRRRLSKLQDSQSVGVATDVGSALVLRHEGIQCLDIQCLSTRLIERTIREASPPVRGDGIFVARQNARQAKLSLIEQARCQWKQPLVRAVAQTLPLTVLERKRRRPSFDFRRRFSSRRNAIRSVCSR